MRPRPLETRRLTCSMRALKRSWAVDRAARSGSDNRDHALEPREKRQRLCHDLLVALDAAKLDRQLVIRALNRSSSSVPARRSK
jgi:hypothetical protein